jgi:hypothetical protein
MGEISMPIMVRGFSRGRRTILLLRGEKAGLREDVTSIIHQLAESNRECSCQFVQHHPRQAGIPAFFQAQFAFLLLARSTSNQQPAMTAESVVSRARFIERIVDRNWGI